MCNRNPPPPPPPPPPPKPQPKEVSAEVKRTRSKERKRLAAVAGRDSTILTPGLGSSSANTYKKTLLGS